MIERHIIALIKQSLKRFPAVLLIGPRQVGKSTVAKQLVDEQIIKSYVTLDDLTVLQAATTDPDGFLQGFSESIALDEIQRVPDLMRALKKRIDEDRKPGQFLLTGSANILAYPEVSESLAGRMDVIHLEGLSLGELYHQPKPSSLISDIFSSVTASELILKVKANISEMLDLEITKTSILQNVLLGGFPPVCLDPDFTYSERWFAAYQQTYLERDVRNISKLVDIIPFSKLLRLIGLRTGNLCVFNALAMELGLDQRMIKRYLGLMDLTFQINFLQPWHDNAHKSLVKTAKVYLNDSGLACFLCGINSLEGLQTDRSMGALFETWVWAEIRKLLVFSPGVQPYFYRTHLGKEVDFVLSKGIRQVGLEFKSATSVSRNDFIGLKDFQTGNQLGIILYMGTEAISFGEHLAAIPIHALL